MEGTLQQQVVVRPQQVGRGRRRRRRLTSPHGSREAIEQLNMGYGVPQFVGQVGGDEVAAGPSGRDATSAAKNPGR